MHVATLLWLLAISAVPLALPLAAIALVYRRAFQVWKQAGGPDSGAKPATFVGMRIRGTDPAPLIEARKSAVSAGLDLGFNELETHALAGGDVARVLTALIHARRDGLELDWDTAASYDLATWDILCTARAAQRDPHFVPVLRPLA